ncbi:MAG TPA: DUF1622 domain-containing protein [Gemmatimonadales bacterium]|jgi:uncharacterized membrane protein
MEEILKEVALKVALTVEAVAVLVITYGAAEAAIKLLVRPVRKAEAKPRRKQVWLDFGVWLLLGLEFELAADIVRSVISPSWTDIGQLGAIAVIRTFLNYFLEQDLEKYEMPEAAPSSKAPKRPDR